ncbi:MAG TPA: hypothetical protein PKO06_20670, partial [Candidatus Ozemobacteraceae bacterium]|nr:hypothetical protein [Candidatus Ozemobacteraceae bacterium]
MKHWKHLLVGAGIAFLSVLPPVNALEVGQYQSILRQKNPPTQTRASGSLLPPSPEPRRPNAP